MYTQDVEGKRKFVAEMIKPMLLEIGMGWKDIRYEYDRETFSEVVVCEGLNPDKSKRVNVWGDSLWGLTEDVMKKVFNLD